jgi:hypothetical protein
MFQFLPDCATLSVDMSSLQKLLENVCKEARYFWCRAIDHLRRIMKASHGGFVPTNHRGSRDLND